MARENISNVENLNIIKDNFENVKVNTKTIVFGKKIFGAPIFELTVESYAYWMYGVINQKVKRLNGKTTNKLVSKVTIANGDYTTSELVKIMNENLIKTMFSYEKIKQMKEIEEVIEEEVDVDDNTRKEQFEAAMIMLKMDDRAYPVFVDAMYRSFKTLSDMTYFSYRERNKETVIHSHFQKLANRLDIVFNQYFGTTFKAYMGFDVYEYREEFINNYFTVSCSKKNHNYVAVLNL